MSESAGLGHFKVIYNGPTCCTGRVKLVQAVVSPGFNASWDIETGFDYSDVKYPGYIDSGRIKSPANELWDAPKQNPTLNLTRLEYNVHHFTTCAICEITKKTNEVIIGCVNFYFADFQHKDTNKQGTFTTVNGGSPSLDTPIAAVDPGYPWTTLDP
jgi:hypothetical protein